jgi:hypothetical protein
MNIKKQLTQGEFCFYEGGKLGFFRKNEIHLIDEVKSVVQKRYKELPENDSSDGDDF